MSCNGIVNRKLNLEPEYNHVSFDNVNSNNITGYVNDNYSNETIRNFERCYLSGNMELNGNPYTGDDFYKSSSMETDISKFINTKDPKSANVCGQGKYVHLISDSVNQENLEKCRQCGNPPDRQSEVDYDINTNIINSSENYYSGDIMVMEQQEIGQEEEPTILGSISERKVGDFEQDYTMYLYNIKDEKELKGMMDDGPNVTPGLLNRDNSSVQQIKAMYEEHGKPGDGGKPANKLDEGEFLDIQRQCSPLISDWFPKQHARNRSGQREELFDMNQILTREIFNPYLDGGRGSDLLQSIPIDIIDFFNREFNSLPELDGLEKHKIHRRHLKEDGEHSILNHIRVLDTDTKTHLDNPSMLQSFSNQLLICHDEDQNNESLCSDFGGKDGQKYYKTIPEELARAWISKKLDSIKGHLLQTQEGNLTTLYGDLKNMFTNINPQVEECINDIVGKDDNAEVIIKRIKDAKGNFTQFGDEEIQYLRRKIVMFIHSPDERVKECIDMLYIQSSTQNLCTEGLYTKTLKILTVLFSLLSVNVDLSDVENNEAKYNSVMNFIDSLGDLFPRAIEKIINIVKDLEKDLCRTTNKSDIIVNLYDDLVNKNRRYNIELGVFGQLFSLDDNQFSRIVDTYNMISPVLGRLFGPTVSE